MIAAGTVPPLDQCPDQIDPIRPRTQPNSHGLTYTNPHQPTPTHTNPSTPAHTNHIHVYQQPTHTNLDGRLTMQLGGLEKICSESSGDSFAVGSTLTVADLAVLNRTRIRCTNIRTTLSCTIQRPLMSPTYDGRSGAWLGGLARARSTASRWIFSHGASQNFKGVCEGGRPTKGAGVEGSSSGRVPKLGHTYQAPKLGHTFHFYLTLHIALHRPVRGNARSSPESHRTQTLNMYGRRRIRKRTLSSLGSYQGEVVSVGTLVYPQFSPPPRAYVGLRNQVRNTVIKPRVLLKRQWTLSLCAAGALHSQLGRGSARQVLGGNGRARRGGSC